MTHDHITYFEFREKPPGSSSLEFVLFLKCTFFRLKALFMKCSYLHNYS